MCSSFKFYLYLIDLWSGEEKKKKDNFTRPALIGLAVPRVCSGSKKHWSPSL